MGEVQKADNYKSKPEEWPSGGNAPASAVKAERVSGGYRKIEEL